MLSNASISGREAGFAKNRTKGIGDERTMDEHDRLAFTSHLILKGDTIEDSAFHDAYLLVDAKHVLVLTDITAA